jgi:ATP-binding cassette subfamily C protein PrsD
LCLLALILYLFQGWFEVIRSRMLVRIAASLDEVLNGRVFQAMLQMPFKARMPGDGMQPLRDFDHIRNFLSGMGPPAFFDLPWMPFYVAICFLFHPLIGWLAIFGAVVLACLTFMTNWSSRKHSKLANEYSNARNGYALLSLRNAEVIRAMGMSGRITKAWQEKNSAHRALMCTTSDVGNGYAAISKIFRLALQSAVLAVGALLVMDGSASAGIMIAATGRVLSVRAMRGDGQVKCWLQRLNNLLRFNFLPPAMCLLLKNWLVLRQLARTLFSLTLILRSMQVALSVLLV